MKTCIDEPHSSLIEVLGDPQPLKGVVVKKLMIVFVAVGLLGSAVVVKAHEAHQHGKPGAPATAKAATTSAKAGVPPSSVTKVNLTGEVVDPQCWFTHNGEGKDHASCAIKCAKGGQDLAFLDGKTGEIHTLIAKGHGSDPNEGFYEHVGVPVRVRGTLYKRGLNSGLLVENIEHIK